MNYVYQDIDESRLSEVVNTINLSNEEIVAVTFTPPLWNQRCDIKMKSGYYTIFTRDKQEVE